VVSVRLCSWKNSKVKKKNLSEEEIRRYSSYHIIQHAERERERDKEGRPSRSRWVWVESDALFIGEDK
jgi:hypothetical protein